MAQNIVNYTVKDVKRTSQPGSTIEAANRSDDDKVVKLSGTVIKDGKTAKTPHIILTRAQAREFAATRTMKGNDISFSLTENRAGRPVSEGLDDDDFEALLGDI